MKYLISKTKKIEDIISMECIDVQDLKKDITSLYRPIIQKVFPESNYFRVIAIGYDADCNTYQDYITILDKSKHELPPLYLIQVK